MEQAILDYIEETKKCIVKAAQLFDVDLTVDNVIIECNVRGRIGGWAHPKKHGKYRVRFNHEAIIKYPVEMADTIPHEIAHLVCFANPIYGKDHDSGWKAVCRRLGGDDSRTHDMVLTPHREKERIRYEYNVLGEICLIGPRQHKKIQSGFTGYFYTHKRLGKNIQISRMMWNDKGVVLNNQTKTWEQTDAPPAGSKRDIALGIYRANRGLARKDIISLFVAQAGMTPAGASTYYQTFKSKNL